MDDLRKWLALIEQHIGATLYHVTPTRNLPKIMQNGLIPKIGRRSRLIDEPVKGIYLFHSEEQAHDAVMNWLGDRFGDDTRLALLAVKVPANAETASGAGYETILTTPVPPDQITVLNRNF